MTISSLPTLLFTLFFPAIVFIIFAAVTFYQGRFNKMSRYVSYFIALISIIFFLEFLRHLTLPSTSTFIHANVSNLLTIAAFCLLSQICYLLIHKHSRFTVHGNPLIFFTPTALYVALQFALTRGNFLPQNSTLFSDFNAGSITLSISVCVSLLFSLFLLFKGLKYAPSRNRLLLYRTLLVTTIASLITIIALPFATSLRAVFFEPALVAAVFYVIILIFSMKNLALSPSLKRNYKMIVDLSPVAIAVLDEDFYIVEMNAKAHELFKFQVETPLQNYFKGSENEIAIINCLQTLQQKKSLSDYQLTYHLQNQHEHMHLSIEAVVIYVEHSYNYYFIIRDVTKEREQELLNYHLAYHDTLTDLHNRAYFVSNVEQHLQFSDTTHLSALVLLDINFFKQINDTYGHQVGDDVLIHIAQLLKQHAKNNPIIARLGGDEFVLYYSSIWSRKTFEYDLRELREVFKQHLFKQNDIILEIVPSFGQAYFPIDSKTFEGLYHTADERMYEDKRLIKQNYESPQNHA